MVLVRLTTHVVAGVMLRIQCSVTACTVASPLFRGDSVGGDYMAIGPTVTQGIEQAC